MEALLWSCDEFSKVSLSIKKIKKNTYYFWILFINACRITLTSDVFWGWKAGRNWAVSVLVNLVMMLLFVVPRASTGVISVTISGRQISSVCEKTLVNCSNNCFLGSKLVGERHVSKTDFMACCSPPAKLNDCFLFLLVLGVLLEVLNKRLFFSEEALWITGVVWLSFSLGGLFVFWGSELCPSGSV